MNRIRKVSFGIALILGSVFCFEQMAFVLLDESQSMYIHATVDFDNSSGHNDDKKEENQQKEYRAQDLNRIHLESLYLSNCSKYGQFRIKHGLEVFLEVVTPPPEA